MKFEFCWEHKKCDKACPVKESQSIFCWRVAQKESLCHSDVCRQCDYRRNWFNHKYSLQAFIREKDKERKRSKAPRILAIDDEPNFLFALEETILDLGYKCLTAVDGEEGLFFAQETVPDLIVTDVLMPKIHGFDLCRALRADPRTGRTPIIIVSVRAAQKDIEEGLAAGASAYLIKPLRPKELAKCIADILPREGPE
jgi:CheY-like chemotaxis protein